MSPHSGTFDPVGVMVHHTAMRGSGLGVIQGGRPGLQGPLANLNLTRSGVWNVVSEGVAWHAGKGSGRVLTEVRADKAPPSDARERGLVDTTTGNPYFIGVEVDNDGVGEPYPFVQLESLARGCAALCAAHGWSANRVIHHREWTARKPDMSYHGALRSHVARLLDAPPQEEPMTPEERREFDALKAEVARIGRPGFVAEVVQSVAMHPDGSGRGYLLDHLGGVHVLHPHESQSGHDLPQLPRPNDEEPAAVYFTDGQTPCRELHVTAWPTPDHNRVSGYTVDFRGGMHTFGPAAPKLDGPYW